MYPYFNNCARLGSGTWYLEQSHFGTFCYYFRTQVLRPLLGAELQVGAVLPELHGLRAADGENLDFDDVGAHGDGAPLHAVVVRTRGGSGARNVRRSICDFRKRF